MATRNKRLTGYRKRKAMQNLPEDQQEKIRNGELKLYRGQDPDRPVIIDENGRIVPGSGRWPNANDPAVVSKTTAHKRTKTYREAMESLMPAEGDPNERGSLAWWYTQAMEAADGSPQRIHCPECGYKGMFAFKKDGNVIFRFVELMHGKPREVMDVNVKSEQLIAILNQRADPNEISVHTIDADEIERREALLKEPD